MISSLRREVDENCALLGYYAASSGDYLPTFRDILFVHLQGSWNLKKGLMGYTETSIKNYNYSLRNIPEDPNSLVLRYVLIFGVYRELIKFIRTYQFLLK